MPTEKEVLRINGHEVTVTNPRKVSRIDAAMKLLPIIRTQERVGERTPRVVPTDSGKNSNVLQSRVRLCRDMRWGSRQAACPDVSRCHCVAEILMSLCTNCSRRSVTVHQPHSAAVVPLTLRFGSADRDRLPLAWLMTM